MLLVNIISRYIAVISSPISDTFTPVRTAPRKPEYGCANIQKPQLDVNLRRTNPTIEGESIDLSVLVSVDESFKTRC